MKLQISFKQKTYRDEIRKSKCFFCRCQFYLHRNISSRWPKSVAVAMESVVSTRYGQESDAENNIFKRQLGAVTPEKELEILSMWLYCETAPVSAASIMPQVF